LIALIIGGVVLLCVVFCAVAAISFYKSGGGQSILRSVKATETAKVATPTPTPPSEQVVYHDSLTDTPTDWINNGDCGFKSDGYHVTGGHACLAPDGATPDTADLSATVTTVKTGQNTGYGLALRRASAGSFYTFEITSDGRWGFLKYADGNASTISDFQSSSAIKTGDGATNDLRVLVVGSHFTFFVNGQQVGALDDSTYTTGRSGVVNDDTDANSEVVFTNFSVSVPAQ
jgi:hypothetical protein